MTRMFIPLLALGMLLIGCSSEPAKDTATTTPAATTAPEPAPVPAVPTAPTANPSTPAPATTAPTSPAPSTEKATITKSEFDQIENGMTLEEVEKIIGGKGELLAEVGKKGEQTYSVVYMFEGEAGIGANANFTFMAGILQGKAQFGLQ